MGWSRVGWKWNKDVIVHLADGYMCGWNFGYIMERDRILRKRRTDKKKKEIEETIRRGVKMDIKKIMGKKVNLGGGVNIRKRGGI